MAEKLKVCHDNLHGIEATKRIHDIILEHQKQSEHISTVRRLYDVLENIGAICAANMLIREAYEVCERRKRTRSDAREYGKLQQMYSETRRNTLPHTSYVHTNPRQSS